MKRKFYKTVIQVTVLSEEPFEYNNLEDINYAITEGDCSGSFYTIKSVVLDAKKAAEELKKQGSDPEFFNISDEE